MTGYGVVGVVWCLVIISRTRERRKFRHLSFEYLTEFWRIIYWTLYYIPACINVCADVGDIGGRPGPSGYCQGVFNPFLIHPKRNVSNECLQQCRFPDVTKICHHILYANRRTQHCWSKNTVGERMFFNTDDSISVQWAEREIKCLPPTLQVL